MRILSLLSTILIALVLTACGGGGGSAGSNPNRPTITTTAPATLSLPLGVVSQYSVQGGVAPYTISTSNPRIVDVSISGNSFWINTVGQGTATVTLRDYNTGSTTITVTVGDELKLSMDTIKSYVGDQIKVQITGGTPPFRASTLDVGVAAAVNGRELLLNLMAVSKIDVTVIDALNNQVKVNVEVIAGSPQFNLVPLAQSIAENSTQPIYLNVIGGVGKLSVQSSDTNLLKASISGNVVTLTTGEKGDRCGGGDVTITVIDSRGAFATATVTLVKNPDGCGLRVSSGTKDVDVVVGSSVRLQVYGVSETGTISVSSSDPTKATATYSNGVLTITGVATTNTPAVPAVPGIPAGCGAAPLVACTTLPVPAVPASNKSVTITIEDSGPPIRTTSFKVNVNP